VGKKRNQRGKTGASNGFWNQKRTRGQVAAETLMAVIILLGLLLVVTVLGWQQNQQATLFKNNAEKATLCRHLSSAIENANNSSAQTNIKVTVTQPVWIDQHSINFSPQRDDFYCYFVAGVNGTSSSEMLSLSIGSYTIRRNSANQVEIVPYCEPLRCGDTGCGINGCNCGTFSDGCGGEIYCGPKPCPSDYCGGFDNGCDPAYTCNCASGTCLSDHTCSSVPG
jgi:hypothetical protein